MLLPALLLLLLAAVIGLALLSVRLRRLAFEHRSLSAEHAAMKDRFRGIVDVDAEKARVLAELAAEKQRVFADLDARRQQSARELETEREQERQKLAALRQQELGAIEVERERLLADTSRIQLNHNQTLQELRGQILHSSHEMEEIRARAQEIQDKALREFQEQQRRGAEELRSLLSNIDCLRSEWKALDEEANLQSFGFYKPRYDFASSDRYQTALEQIRERQKRMIKDKSASVCQIRWTVNGSVTEGRKQVNQTLKLILRAFNGECDAAIAKVKYNNVRVMEARIYKAYDAINALVEVQQCQITSAYLNLKIDELHLVHEYQEKVQEEKGEQRRIREEMREEELALREMERAQQEAEREEKRYAESLRNAREEVQRAVGEKQQKLTWQIEELQRRLQEAQTRKERAVARAEMTRSGHVYVISNVGSFGEEVYKIGMTRRLDPLDRVRELGDASVPFQFDVHAIIYSEDAPKLENALHRTFQHRRVNRVNERKEFFRASIDEIAEAVHQHHGEIEFTRAAEAAEYRKTVALLQVEQPVPAAQAIPQTLLSGAAS